MKELQLDNYEIAHHHLTTNYNRGTSFTTTNILNIVNVFTLVPWEDCDPPTQIP